MKATFIGITGASGRYIALFHGRGEPTAVFGHQDLLIHEVGFRSSPTLLLRLSPDLGILDELTEAGCDLFQLFFSLLEVEFSLHLFSTWSDIEWVSSSLMVLKVTSPSLIAWTT